MNLIEETNENFNYIINKILMEPNPDLKKYNLIVAGGFPLFAFQLSDQMNSKMFELKVKKYLHKKTIGRMCYIKDMFAIGCGDIDIWFKASETLESKHSFLIEEHKIEYDLDFFSKKNDAQKLSLGGINMSLSTSSKWANTFRQYNYNLSNAIQIVKRRPKDIVDLFKDFDFENCKVAFYDDKLIYSEEALSAFEREELVLSNDKVFKNNSLAGKVYACLRAFKYAKRHILDFDVELTNLVFNIMLEVCNMEEDEYEDYLNNDYNKSKCDTNKFFSMVDTLMQNLTMFSEMKYYQKHWSAFFLNNKNSKKILGGTNLHF